MAEISVPAEVLQYIGNLSLTKHLEVELKTQTEQRFQKVFEILANISCGVIKPEQLWIDLKNKIWDVRPLDTPNPLPVTTLPTEKHIEKQA